MMPLAQMRSQCKLLSQGPLDGAWHCGFPPRAVAAGTSVMQTVTPVRLADVMSV